MLSTNQNIPPIFQKIIEQLQQLQGKQEYIQLEQFRNILINLRIQREEVDQIEKYLKDMGAIQRIGQGNNVNIILIGKP